MSENIEQTIAFYDDLGFHMVNRGTRSAEFETESTRLKVEADFDEDTLEAFGLTQPSGTRGEGVIIGVEVDSVDDMAEVAKQTVADHGGNVLAGPRDTDWGRRLLLVQDPDGYVIEFSQPV